MLPTADTIRADFERIAACSAAAPDHLEVLAQRLLAEVPLRARVLEIGCGTGQLARDLAAKRGARVTAIDLSPRVIDVARVRTPSTLGVEYRVADFLALSPRGFDVVIAVNTLHHLPLAEAAARMGEAVVSGGKVLVADLFSARGLAALPYTGLSWLARGSCPTDPIATFAHVRRELRRVLPDVAVRRHLGWRYTAAWQRADKAGV